MVLGLKVVSRIVLDSWGIYTYVGTCIGSVPFWSAREIECNSYVPWSKNLLRELWRVYIQRFFQFSVIVREPCCGQDVYHGLVSVIMSSCRNDIWVCVCTSVYIYIYVYIHDVDAGDDGGEGSYELPSFMEDRTTASS